MLSRWRLTIIPLAPEQSRSSSLSTRISIPLSHLTFVLTVRYYSQHGAVLVVVLRPVRLTDELVRRRPCGTMRMGAAARGSLPRSCKRFRGQDVETRSRRAPAGRSGGVGAVTRAPLGVVRSVPETRRLLEDAMREVLAVARAPRGCVVR